MWTKGAMQEHFSVSGCLFAPSNAEVVCLASCASGCIRSLGYPRSCDLKVASLRAAGRPCGPSVGGPDYPQS